MIWAFGPFSLCQTGLSGRSGAGCKGGALGHFAKFSCQVVPHIYLWVRKKQFAVRSCQWPQRPSWGSESVPFGFRCPEGLSGESKRLRWMLLLYCK